MFSNNYKAIFELLGGNQIFNNFNESTIEENKTEILANQPAKFEYLTEFKGEDESGLEERLRRINSVCSFTIQTAKAQTTMRDSTTGKTITVKHFVYRAMDRTTGLQFDFKAEQNTWHVQRIAWKDYNKPKGYYSAKAAMKRFKKELLDGLGKDFAYGRSVASQYPVKRNRFGDWRGKLANIKDKKGKRSKGLRRNKESVVLANAIRGVKILNEEEFNGSNNGKNEKSKSFYCFCCIGGFFRGGFCY
jgi:hypothetical protein